MYRYQNDNALAVMFADITDSTQLYDNLGDTEAQETIANCINMLIDIVVKNHGSVIKTIGDEVMCTFIDASTAAHTALVLLDQACLHATKMKSTLQIRIGFHFGPVIWEKNDIFGDTVNIAARMVSQAKAQQIIVTKKTTINFPLEIRQKVRFIGSVVIKGKKKPVDICELIWGEEDDDITTSSQEYKLNVKHTAPKQIEKLKISSHTETQYVDQENIAINLGRDANNSLVINHTTTSRLHATIEYRRNKFHFIDKSTNGSIVITSDNQEKQFIHRDDIILPPSGYIVLGHKEPDNNTNIISFSTNLEGFESARVIVFSDSEKMHQTLDFLLTLNDFELVDFFNINNIQSDAVKLASIDRCSADAIFVDLGETVTDEVMTMLEELLDKTALPILFSENTVGNQKKDEKYYGNLLKKLKSCCHDSNQKS